MSIELLPATDEHWAELVENIREEVVAEVWESHHILPADMQARASSSYDVTALVYDGELLGITGITPETLWSDIGCPWFLTTPAAEKHPLAVCRVTKAFINLWLKDYSVLRNWIDARFEKAVSWAKWAGFTVGEAEIINDAGASFHRIEIRRP